MTTLPTPAAYLYTTPSGARVVDLKRVDLDTPGLTVSGLITVEQAQAYADARVREALEAAKELADWAEHEVGVDPELTPGLQAIRALIPQR